MLGQKSEAVRERERSQSCSWLLVWPFHVRIVLAGCGLLTEGAAVIEKGLTIDPGNTCLLAIRAFIHRQDSKFDEARRILRELEESHWAEAKLIGDPDRQNLAGG